MSATQSLDHQAPAEGLSLITLPVAVVRLLCEAAFWPCILSGIPDGEGESPFWGTKDDMTMDAVRKRLHELASIFERAEILTRTETGKCLPDAFLVSLVGIVGGAG